MMRRLALILLLLLGCRSVGASPPPTEPPRSPVYVLLIGHDRAPGLPRLEKVYYDIVQMHRFFSVLQPDRTFVHADADRLGLEPGRGGVTDVRPPTLSAVSDTIEELRDLIDAGPVDARIYIFYAGHGRRTLDRGRVSTELYLEPGGDGHDGRLRPAELAEHVLDPLADRADIHLIVDACQSYFLLAARGDGVEQLEAVPKRPGSVVAEMERRFRARYPRVGIVTAARDLTFEDPSQGGLFSFAVRASAAGLADRDGDGRITYRELEAMVRWVLHTRLGPVTPGIVGPGGDEERVFIDYRSVAARSVVFPAGRLRYTLLDENRMSHIVVYPGPERSEAIYLPGGHVYYAVGTQPGTETREDFILQADEHALRHAPRTIASHRGPAALFGLPPPPDIDAVLPPKPTDEWLPSYLGLSVGAGVQVYPNGLPGGVSWAPAVELGVALGRGRWQGAAGLRYGIWEAEQWPVSYKAHHIDVTLGAEFHLLTGESLEGTLGVEIGGGPVLQHSQMADEWLVAATVLPAAYARLTFSAPGLGLPMFIEGHAGLRAITVEAEDPLLAPAVGLVLGSRLEHLLRD